MNSFQKYLIFFILGIILSLIIFKKDLVEGHLKINSLWQGRVEDLSDYVVKNFNDKLSGDFTIDVETIEVGEEHQRFLRVGGLICDDGGTAIRGGDDIGGPIVAHTLIPCAGYLNGDSVMNPPSPSTANTFAFVGPPDSTYGASRCKIFYNETNSCNDSVDQNYEIYTKCEDSNSGVIVYKSGDDVIMKCGTCPDGYLNLDPDNSPYCKPCPELTIPNEDRNECVTCGEGQYMLGSEFMMDDNEKVCTSIPENAIRIRTGGCSRNVTNPSLSFNNSDLCKDSPSYSRYNYTHVAMAKKGSNTYVYNSFGRLIPSWVGEDQSNHFVFTEDTPIYILDPAQTRYQENVDYYPFVYSESGRIRPNEDQSMAIYAILKSDVYNLTELDTSDDNYTTMDIICPAGTYKEIDETRVYCRPCPAGKYSSEDSEGSSSCIDCPAGTYSSEGSSSCTTCGEVEVFDSVLEQNVSIDSYTPNEGSTECISIPPYSTVNESRTNYICDDGFEAIPDNELPYQCSNCPRGRVSTNGDSCEVCPDGQTPAITRTNTTVGSCMDCPAGTYGTNGFCTACSGMTFQDETGQTSCKEITSSILGYKPVIDENTGDVFYDSGVDYRPYTDEIGPVRLGCDKDYYFIEEDVLNDRLPVPQREPYLSLGWNNYNKLCADTRCKISEEDNDKYEITNLEDSNGLISETSYLNFKPNIQCRLGYKGFPSARSCNPVPQRTTYNSSVNLGASGGEMELTGCYPEDLVDSATGTCADNIENFDLTDRCQEINKLVLDEKKCNGIECVNTNHCCTSDIPDDTFNLFNQLLYGNESINTSPTTWSEINLKPGVVDSFKTAFNTKDNFENNWIGEGGGEQELASDVWKRLIRTVNSYSSDSAEQITEDTDFSLLTDSQIEEYIKKFLFNLDQPIMNEDNSFKFPNEGSGLSPLDLFLYNDPEGINANQLEALL